MLSCIINAQNRKLTADSVEILSGRQLWPFHSEELIK